MPESFKVLVRELNSLGLAIEAQGGVYSEEEDITEGEELAKEMGAKVVATDELTAPKGPMEIEEVVSSK